jgi:hypothetical protein
MRKGKMKKGTLPKDVNLGRNQDPLVNLYQADNIKDINLDQEVIDLIKRLLNNVEEFYQLRDMVRVIIKNEEENYLNKFFNNLRSKVMNV